MAVLDVASGLEEARRRILREVRRVQHPAAAVGMRRAEVATFGGACDVWNVAARNA